MPKTTYQIWSCSFRDTKTNNGGVYLLTILNGRKFSIDLLTSYKKLSKKICITENALCWYVFESEKSSFLWLLNSTRIIIRKINVILTRWHRNSSLLLFSKSSSFLLSLMLATDNRRWMCKFLSTCSPKFVRETWKWRRRDQSIYSTSTLLNNFYLELNTFVCYFNIFFEFDLNFFVTNFALVCMSSTDKILIGHCWRTKEPGFSLWNTLGEW